MGVGPFGAHIDNFPDVCVETIGRSLEEGLTGKQNASEIGARLLEEAGGDPSGTKRNVECVVKMSESTKPYQYSQEEDESAVMRRRSVAKNVYDGDLGVYEAKKLRRRRRPMRASQSWR